MFNVHRSLKHWQQWFSGLGVLVFVLGGSASSAIGQENSTETSGGVDLNTTPSPQWMPKPSPNADADAADQSGMKKYTETITGTEVAFPMVPIPGGTYKMGSPAAEKGRKDDEGPLHEVKIDPFWMGSP